MTSELDKMLADLDGFNRMMDDRGTNRKASGVAYSAPANRDTSRRISFAAEKLPKNPDHINAITFFKSNWKSIGVNATLATGAMIGGVAMINAAPVAGLAVMVFGPGEAIRLKNGFMSGLKKFQESKKENPNMSKMQRFKKAASFGMKNYVKSTINHHKQSFKQLKQCIKDKAAQMGKPSALEVIAQQQKGRD